jgi:hypothetical protein
MTASEIERVEALLAARVEQVLSAEQFAQYNGYRRRLEAQIERRETEPLPMTPAERAAFELIEADAEARGLRAQLDILTGLRTSRQ